MRIITDKSFEGEEGMLLVWNQTPGFLQISEEGHLLQSAVSAWVDETPTVQGLIESGELVVIKGIPVKAQTPKKSTKARAKATNQSDNTSSEDQPVAPTQDPEVTDNNDSTQPQPEDSATLDSLVLDSSQLEDDSASVSVENI